jgi:hypothetical protein
MGAARGCGQGSPEIERQMEAVEPSPGLGPQNPAFRQMFTTIFMPDATPEQMQWFNELQRRTASPDNAANILRSVTAFDVDDLWRVRVPTLVLHCRGDAVQR